MIIVSDDSSSSDTKKEDVKASASGPLSRIPSEKPPPSYLDSTGTLSTISSTSTHGTDRRSTPDIKPSNFINVNRANGSIKGSWLIDPSLSIPSSFLPPPTPEGVRKNLILESKNGGIDADIYLLPTSHSNKNASKLIVIHTQSFNGSVKTRLHDTKSSNGEARLAVRLSTRSFNGSVHVQLPRSFRGPIRIKTVNGNTRFSAAMQTHLTIFSELDHVQRSFLGDFNPSQWDIGAPWEGDELSIESKNGSVNVSFDDESQGSYGQSFISKLLSDMSL